MTYEANGTIVNVTVSSPSTTASAKGVEGSRIARLGRRRIRCDDRDLRVVRAS